MVIGDISGWDTSNVTDMSLMFENAGYGDNWSIGDISGWDTLMLQYVIDVCFSWRECNNWSIGDLSGWDTSNVTDMYGMFYKAGYSAASWSIGDISGWDTSNIYRYVWDVL